MFLEHLLETYLGDCGAWSGEAGGGQEGGMQLFMAWRKCCWAWPQVLGTPFQKPPGKQAISLQRASKDPVPFQPDKLL